MTGFHLNRGRFSLNRLKLFGVLAVLALPFSALPQKHRKKEAQTKPPAEKPQPSIDPITGLPRVTALAAIVLDPATGQVLYEKNADMRLAPASTTKIMTGLLLLEKCLPGDLLVAPTTVKDVKESSAHLMPGERLSAKEMLYALMLRSANDGCHTVACHISGDETKFAKLMNERAKELGCTSTNFANPHGLPNDSHWTTARDLTKMASQAMKYPDFAKAVATQKHVLKRSMNTKDTLLVNRDRWLGMDVRAKGIKTGFTRAAGQCFVGYAVEGDRHVMTAILKSQNWVADQQFLVDWAFKEFQLKTLIEKGQLVGSIPVERGQVPSVDLVAQESVVKLARANEPAVSWKWDEGKAGAPILAGEVLRSASAEIGGKTVTVNLVAARSVKEVNLAATLATPTGLAGAMLLGLGAVFFRHRSRQWAK